MSETLKKTLLFVDDRPSTHEYFRKRLDPELYTVKLAFDLREAVDAVKASGISLAVIDLNMPGKFPTELSPHYYKYSEVLRLNEGQLFGLYCRDRSIPYFYLTAHEDAFNLDIEGNMLVRCLPKSCNRDRFMSVLQQTLDEFSDRLQQQ